MAAVNSLFGLKRKKYLVERDIFEIQIFVNVILFLFLKTTYDDRTYELRLELISYKRANTSRGTLKIFILEVKFVLDYFNPSM